MKFLIFSDIHGNITTLLKMLNQVKNYNINSTIFCGDLIGYFPYQDSVIECVRNMSSLYAVMGNHDFQYINALNNKRKRNIYAEKYGKGYLQNISVLARNFVEQLPHYIEFERMGKKILIVHGSIENYLEGRIYPDTKIIEDKYQKYDFVILGHTHYQMYRKMGKTVFLNPGSLGQPRDYNGFSYCIFDIETEEVEFFKVEIDQEKLINDLVSMGENENLIGYIESKYGGNT